MRHYDIIYLVEVTLSQDELGNQLEVEAERKVYANQVSVSSAEFYNAGTSGLKPEKSFRLHTFEYQGEKYLNHENVRYEVIRTASIGDKTTLICERSVARG